MTKDLTIHKIFPATVSGPNELKTLITTAKKLVEDVDAQFTADLQQPNARVQKPVTCLGSRDFDCEMCRVTHDSFIHTHTVLTQYSKWLQAKDAVNVTLDALENARTTLVTLRQQKREMTRDIRITIGQEKSQKIQVVQTSSGEIEPYECDLDYQNPVTQKLEKLIEKLKENYRANTRKILNQLRPVLASLKREVSACILAAEETIGSIIEHAEKCRSFILQCQYIAFVEYCFSEWWITTQKDKDDEAEYYVSAVLEGVPTRFNASDVQQRFLFTTFSTDPNPKIKIEIHAQNETRDNSFPLVFDKHLDEELATAIFTERSILAFESDETPTSYHRRYGTISTKFPVAVKEPSVFRWA